MANLCPYWTNASRCIRATPRGSGCAWTPARCCRSRYAVLHKRRCVLYSLCKPYNAHVLTAHLQPGPCSWTLTFNNLNNAHNDMSIMLRAHLSVFEVGFERLHRGPLGHELALPPLVYPPTQASSRSCDEWFVVQNKYGTQRFGLR